MAELKTKQTKQSVTKFLDAIEDPQKRKDAKAVHKLMREATGCRAAMWGPAIIGYGNVHLRYESGRELDWFLTGFSPRKQNLSLYVLDTIGEDHRLLKKLGKYKAGKGCLYIKQLADVDVEVLRELIETAVTNNRKRIVDD